MDELGNRIVRYLLDVSEVPFTALAIAKAVVGSDATAKDVRPSLYELEKQGRIHKMEEEGRPRWVLASSKAIRRPESLPDREPSLSSSASQDLQGNGVSSPNSLCFGGFDSDGSRSAMASDCFHILAPSPAGKKAAESNFTGQSFPGEPDEWRKSIQQEIDFTGQGFPDGSGTAVLCNSEEVGQVDAESSEGVAAPGAQAGDDILGVASLAQTECPERVSRPDLVDPDLETRLIRKQSYEDREIQRWVLMRMQVYQSKTATDLEVVSAAFLYPENRRRLLGVSTELRQKAYLVDPNVQEATTSKGKVPESERKKCEVPKSGQDKVTVSFPGTLFNVQVCKTDLCHIDSQNRLVYFGASWKPFQNPDSIKVWAYYLVPKAVARAFEDVKKFKNDKAKAQNEEFKILEQTIKDFKLLQQPGIFLVMPQQDILITQCEDDKGKFVEENCTAIFEYLRSTRQKVQGDPSQEAPANAVKELEALKHKLATRAWADFAWEPEFRLHIMPKLLQPMFQFASEHGYLPGFPTEPQVEHGELDQQEFCKTSLFYHEHSIQCLQMFDERLQKIEHQLQEMQLSTVRRPHSLVYLRARILQDLRQAMPAPVSTLNIAKNALGNQATKKDVNPALHELEKLGLVQKLEGNGGPKWTLAGNT